MGDWIYDHLGWVALALGVVLAVLMVFMFIAHGSWVDEMNRQCGELGGLIARDTNTGVGTGIGADGQVTTVVTSSTTYFCLSEDGRILFIR